MHCQFGAATLALTLSQSALAQTPDSSARVIATRLDCGPLLPGGSRPAFTSPISFTVSKGTLKGERQLTQDRGVESYRGAIDPLGRIKIGGKYEGDGSRELRFAGQLSDTRPTVLNGRLEVTAVPIGFRDCRITFTDKPSVVMETFS